MTVWLVRAGSHGERETLALEQGLSVVGFPGIPDLTGIDSSAVVQQIVRKALGEASDGRVASWTTQLWTFFMRMQLDDLVALPLKSRREIAVGVVSGPYVYRPDLPAEARHTRSTNWLLTDIPRSTFDQDLLRSLGAFRTVCQIQRNNAEARIRSIVGERSGTIRASK